MGSIVSTDGGTEEDVKARLGKARVAFHMLDKLWKSKIISRPTKLKIFNSNVSQYYCMDRKVGEPPNSYSAKSKYSSTTV